MSAEKEELASVSNYSISQAARFFEKSIAWIRWKERIGTFKREDGTLIEPARTTPRRSTTSAQRRYSLDDIREMAEALLRQGQISQETFDQIKAKIDAFS